MKLKWIGAAVLLVGTGAAAIIWAAHRAIADETPETSATPQARITDTPTSAEFLLIQQAKAAKWPTRTSRTEPGTDTDGVHIYVYTDRGRAKLVLSGDGQSFRVVSYLSGKGIELRSRNGLPAETTQDNLSYARFLTLIEEHGLDNPTEQS